MKFDPNDPRLTAYVLGELDEAEREVVDTMLETCPESRRVVEEIRATAELLTNELKQEACPALTPPQRAAITAPPVPARRRFLVRHWKPLTAAASLLLAVGTWAAFDARQAQESTALARIDSRAAQPSASFPDESPLQYPSPQQWENLTRRRAVAHEGRSTPGKEQASPSPLRGLYVDAGTPTTPAESEKQAIIRQRVLVERLNKKLTGLQRDPGFGVVAAARAADGGRTVNSSPALTDSKQSGGIVSNFDPLLDSIENTVEVDTWDPQGQAVYNSINFSFASTFGKRLNTAVNSRVDAFLCPADVDHNTEAYARIVDNPFLAVADNPLSTFAIDVDTASYANVRRFLNQGVLPPPDAVRIEELVNYFTYDYTAPEGDAPFSSHVEVAGCPWAPEHRLVRVALKGREIKDENRPASNLVFLLDVSGSMSPENKLPLLKKAMRLLVERLTENDRVGIVVYASSSSVALPSTTADNHETILAAIEGLSAGGSTNGGSGIQLAYDMAVSHFIPGGTNRVILCTDGDFNVGVTDQGQLHRLIEAKAKSGVFLSVLGFGMGNLKDSTLETLADKGNGNYAYIDTLNEARKVLVEEMGGTLVTIAKDVKIQVEFNPKEVAAYRLIGYENRLLAAEDFNNDKKDAGEIGAGHAVTALYEIVPAGKTVDLPKVDELKYQKHDELADAAFNGELMELKLRYKEPDGETSKLLKFPVKDEGKDFGQASDDFKFAASVAAFGMLLRGSPYKGNATLAAVSEIAEDGKGADRHGYRAEFLDLVTKAKTMSGRKLTAEDAEDTEK